MDYKERAEITALYTSLIKGFSSILPYEHTPTNHWENLARRGFIYDVLTKQGEAFCESTSDNRPPLTLNPNDYDLEAAKDYTFFRVTSRIDLNSWIKTLDQSHLESPPPFNPDNPPQLVRIPYPQNGCQRGVSTVQSNESTDHTYSEADSPPLENTPDDNKNIKNPIRNISNNIHKSSSKSQSSLYPTRDHIERGKKDSEEGPESQERKGPFLETPAPTLNQTQMIPSRESPESTGCPQRSKLGVEWFLEQHGTCWLYPLNLYGVILGFAYRATSAGSKGATWLEPITVYTPQICSWTGFPGHGTPLVLVEGVADAEALSLVYPHCVALLTAKCSLPQAWLLSMLTDRVILCFDNDDSGARGIRTSRKNLTKYGVHVRELKLSHKLNDLGDLLKPGKWGQSQDVVLDLRAQLMGLGVV